jgi:hypothetical protein
MGGCHRTVRINGYKNIGFSIGSGLRHHRFRKRQRCELRAQHQGASDTAALEEVAAADIIDGSHTLDLLGSRFHSGKYALIRAAAANVPGHSVDNILVGWVGFSVE